MASGEVCLLIVAMIPARIGSVRLPRKNQRELGGKLLPKWTIDEALKVKEIDKIVYLIDDIELANGYEQYVDNPRFEILVEKKRSDGARPAWELIQYVTNATGMTFSDILVFLQPTVPLRNYRDIQNCINMFISNDCNNVMSVCEAKDHPSWCFRISYEQMQHYNSLDFRLRSQDLDPVYVLNGAIYVSDVNTIYRQKGYFGGIIRPYIMPRRRSVDIDTELDFDIVQFLALKEKAKLEEAFEHVALSTSGGNM